MSSTPDFQDVQKAFCAHLRDPDKHPAPTDVEARRTAVYEGLFFRNMVGTFRDFFPTTASLYTQDGLERLVRSFFAHHQSHTPYFHYLGQEFRDYLNDEHTPTDEDPPFLAELADYEWVGMTLRIHDRSLDVDVVPLEDVDEPLTHPLVLTPHHAFCIYSYPVHTISADNQPDAPPAVPTFLLIFRAATKTRHMELNPATARLVQLLSTQPEIAAATHMETVASELPQVSLEAVLSGGASLVEELAGLGAILGCRSRGKSK